MRCRAVFLKDFDIQRLFFSTSRSFLAEESKLPQILRESKFGKFRNLI